MKIGAEISEIEANKKIEIAAKLRSGSLKKETKLTNFTLVSK